MRTGSVPFCTSHPQDCAQNGRSTHLAPGGQTAANWPRAGAHGMVKGIAQSDALCTECDRGVPPGWSHSSGWPKPGGCLWPGAPPQSRPGSQSRRRPRRAPAATRDRHSGSREVRPRRTAASAAHRIFPNATADRQLAAGAVRRHQGPADSGCRLLRAAHRQHSCMLRPG